MSEFKNFEEFLDAILQKAASPKKPNVRTMYSKLFDQWYSKEEGTDNYFGYSFTKSAAAEAGRQRAIQNQSEHTVCNEDGTIGYKNSYGNDPCPPKDGAKK